MKSKVKAAANAPAKAAHAPKRAEKPAAKNAKTAGAAAKKNKNQESCNGEGREDCGESCEAGEN